MKALRFNAINKKLEIENLEIPNLLNDDSVLIKVAYAGICGTDLHIIQGEFPCHPTKTFTMGHEFSGTVVDVGKLVKHIKINDTVSVDPNSGCHCCGFCHTGRPHFCKVGGINNTIGIYRDGGWAEYVVVPIGQVHQLPASITLDRAALAEPFSCLAHGWDVIAPITVGQKILVTGAGIIGNLWACALHHQGHRDVTISEPNVKRLETIKALETGFKLKTPKDIKDDDEYDLVIDCSGAPPAIEQGFKHLKSGGKLCIFGVAPPHGIIRISPFEIYMKEAKILGVNINPYTFPKSLGLLEAMGERYIQYDKLGIRVFAVEDYKEALECLKQGTIAKAVFKF